jgi:hypothetical protein
MKLIRNLCILLQLAYTAAQTDDYGCAADGKWPLLAENPTCKPNRQTIHLGFLWHTLANSSLLTIAATYAACVCAIAGCQCKDGSYPPAKQKDADGVSHL